MTSNAKHGQQMSRYGKVFEALKKDQGLVPAKEIKDKPEDVRKAYENLKEGQAHVSKPERWKIERKTT